MLLAGIDLAWQSTKNPSAIAIGQLTNNHISVIALHMGIIGTGTVIKTLTSIEGLKGIAVDAPLIINNWNGQRICEKELSSVYGSRGASCHTSNRKLYPNPSSVYLSEQLQEVGFSHLVGHKWQIECYPHPSIIEIFGLSQRLKYKKGKVSEKKTGQRILAGFIHSLEHATILKMFIKGEMAAHLMSANIMGLAGKGLKMNEDALDALVCLYIAGLYSVGSPGRKFGSVEDGYIWVPRGVCI